MDTLREKQTIRGLRVASFKQSNTDILCKVNISTIDAKALCDRTLSGLFKNKELHSRLINMIVTEVEKSLQGESNG